MRRYVETIADPSVQVVMRDLVANLMERRLDLVSFAFTYDDLQAMCLDELRAWNERLIEKNKNWNRATVLLPIAMYDGKQWPKNR